MKRRLYYLGNALKKHRLLVPILVLGILLRGLEVYTKNYLFIYDHGLYYEDVRAMVESGRPSLIGTYSPVPGLFQGPYFYYLLSIFYILFDGDPYGGMVMMFLVGIVSVIASYYLAYQLFGKLCAVVVALLFSISPAAVSASRMLWPPYLIFLLMPFYLYFLIKTSWGSFKSALFSLFTASLIFSLEIPAGAVLFLPVLVVLFIFQRAMLTITFIGAGILVTFIPLLPNILFNFRHDNITGKGVWGVLNGTYKLGSEINTYAQSISQHSTTFLGNFSSTFFWRTPPLPAIAAILIVMTIGLFILMKKSAKKEKTAIASLTLVPVLVYIQWLPLKSVLWGWYLVMLHPLYIFLASFFLWRLTGRAKGGLISIGVIVLLVIQAGSQLHFIATKERYDEGGSAKIRGKLKALDYIYSDASGAPFNALVFMPPVYTYPYDYLFNWYGKKRYGYVPGKEKEGVFYLLIEPDPAKPWSYNGWLETVIVSGDTEWTYELEGGLILQKRYAD